MKKKETPFEKRSCYDCSFVVGYVNLWCSNKKAIKDRGTSIPGCVHCPHWEPDWDYIKEKYHTPEYGYRKSVDGEIVAVWVFIVFLILLGVLMVCLWN